MIVIRKKIEIHFGFSDFGRHFGLAVMWGWNWEPPTGRSHWNHHLFITIDPEDYHNFGRAFKRLLPRITHG